MLVWGHGRQIQTIAPLIQLEECPACAKPTILHLGVLKKDFRLYWIPVARWNSAFFVFCPVCQGSFEVDKPVGQRTVALLKQGGQLTDPLVQEILGIREPALPPQAPNPAEQTDGRLIVECAACNQKNRVGVDQIPQARCGRCSEALVA